MAKKLESQELATAMSRLPGWEVRDGKLARTYRFRDFADAFAFMAACALRIHALDHHPEWCNTYSTVKIALVTHDAQGITAKDAELAAVMESIAGRFPKA
jgi:4a-hydroxytetrahydrobiopterin dehydratase